MNWRICILVLIGALLGFTVFSWFTPPPGGVLAHAELPDGAEVLVTQERGGEPLTVSLYIKEPKGEWGWCYLDHETFRWSRTTIEFDPEKNSVDVYRGDTLVCSWLRETGRYLNRRQGRETAAPQEVRTPSVLVENVR